jgi:ankyrin repeat protein
MYYAYNPENGQTDLMAAAHNGDADETAHILSMPCDIDAQDSHGMTALMYAAVQGHADVLQVLANHHANLELQSAQRYTALMYAVRKGHTTSVQALLAAKADPDVHRQNNTFDTPLTLAAWCGFLPIVRALIAAGADVALAGGLWQLPPEGIARRQGHHHISEFLLYHEKKP